MGQVICLSWLMKAPAITPIQEMPLEVKNISMVETEEIAFHIGEFVKTDFVINFALS